MDIEKSFEDACSNEKAEDLRKCSEDIFHFYDVAKYFFKAGHASRTDVIDKLKLENSILLESNKRLSRDVEKLVEERHHLTEYTPPTTLEKCLECYGLGTYKGRLTFAKCPTCKGTGCKIKETK